MRPSVLTGTQEKEIAAKPGSAFKECASGCPTMIVVPAGKFTMGSPETEKDRSNDEGPQHQVIFAKPFAVGKTDVTFADWDICVTAGACPKVSDNGWGRDDRPVILVSWDEAKGYVTWLKLTTGKDYRLLSEAEWEYTARAGNQGRYSFGEDETQLGDYAWYVANSEEKTHPVATKKNPTPLGSTTCTVMSGNGSRIAMTAAIGEPRRTDLHGLRNAIPVCFAAAPGTTIQVTSARLAAARMPAAAGTASWVSVSGGRLHPNCAVCSAPEVAARVNVRPLERVLNI